MVLCSKCGGELEAAGGDCCAAHMKYFEGQLD